MWRWGAGRGTGEGMGGQVETGREKGRGQGEHDIPLGNNASPANIGHLAPLSELYRWGVRWEDGGGTEE